MTEQQFKIAFTKAMLEWYENGEVGPDPRYEWEYCGASGEWRQNYRTEKPYFTKSMSYRWKQPNKRTITIDGVELVAPELAAFEVGTYVYVMTLASAESHIWGSPCCNYDWLAMGLIFLTREDAQAMSDAQRKQRMGGVL